jgi:hypothetical protein
VLHLHAHVAHHSAGPTIGGHSADEDAIEIDWRIAPAPTSAPAPDLAVYGRVIVPPPRFFSATISVPQPRGHDPPGIDSAQPRSPPA